MKNLLLVASIATIFCPATSNTLHAKDIARKFPVDRSISVFDRLTDRSISALKLPTLSVVANAAPAAPSGLKFNATNATSIELRWVDNATDEVEYVIERSAGNNTQYSQLVVLPANTTQFTDATTSVGWGYYYRISARNASGASDWLEEMAVGGEYSMGNKTITACVGTLVDSAGGFSNYDNNENYTLTLLPGTPGFFVKLQFYQFKLEDADKLSIYNGSSTSDPLIGTFSGDTLLAAIQASNPYGGLTLVFKSNETITRQGWSASVSCSTAPSNVQVNVQNTNQIELSWIDNAPKETGFAIERSTKTVFTSTPFTPLAMLLPNATTYVDNAVVSNTTYIYRVQAMAADGVNNSDIVQTQALSFGKGGIWRERTGFSATPRDNAVAFVIGKKGFVGLGGMSGTHTSTFRSYDPATDSWSVVADFEGTARSEAVAFSIGTKGYVGTGSSDILHNDFWEYDQTTNEWTEKKDFSGTARAGGVGFSIGNKGYFGLGRDASGFAKDFWRYDPASDTWTEVAPFPGVGRTGAVAFVIGDFAYVGTGSNGSSQLSDFYKYNSTTNSWSAIAAFPNRTGAVAFVINGRGYVGTGTDFEKSFYVYDPTVDKWEEAAYFGGSGRRFASGFAIDDRGFVAAGFDNSQQQDLWALQVVEVQPAPVAPTNFLATAISTSRIDLSWTDNTSNETGFEIERSTDNVSYALITTASAGSTTYSDTGLQIETKYYYRVKANTPAGNSSVVGTSASTYGPPPPAPTNLKAVFNEKKVQLSWIDNAANETSYVVERSAETNTNYEYVGGALANGTTMTDVGLFGYSTTYYWRVKAVNGPYSSSYSNEVSLTTGPSPVLPPSNVSAKAVSSSSIQVRWTDNTFDEAGFAIYRSLNASGPFVSYSAALANATSFFDVGLDENTTYYYKVSAHNNLLGSSSRSEAVFATTLKSIPGAPTELIATYDVNLDDIVLAWKDNATNEEDFVIEKAFSQDSFTKAATTTNTTFTDVNPGTKYGVLYRVAARNNGGVSQFSNVARVIITGLEDTGFIAGVKTYPNPATDKLMIEWTSSDRGEVTVSLCDLTGRILKEEKFDKNHEALKEEITLANVAGNAMVIMRMSIGAKSVTKKIVIK